MRSILSAVILACAAIPASATTIAWTDWVTEVAGKPTGVISAPGGTINVTFTGTTFFMQYGCGTAFWSPGTYNGAFNKPPACDMVALGTGGTRTISFDVPVKDPYIALMSWNGNTADFGTPIEIVANGTGFYGSGTPILNDAGTGFFGSGEVHGIIRLPGTFTSITFTHTTEFWHGFTVGVLDRAPPPGGVVPEPATWAMLIAGFGLVGATMRRRRRALARA
ncbi:MAG: PEPxxWA-CTERM sorting domain-containing protein [Sphingomonadaceae bacterium]